MFIVIFWIKIYLWILSEESNTDLIKIWKTANKNMKCKWTYDFSFISTFGFLFRFIFLLFLFDISMTFRISDISVASFYLPWNICFLIRPFFPHILIMICNVLWNDIANVRNHWMTRLQTEKNIFGKGAPEKDASF